MPLAVVTLSPYSHRSSGNYSEGTPSKRGPLAAQRASPNRPGRNGSPGRHRPERPLPVPIGSPSNRSNGTPSNKGRVSPTRTRSPSPNRRPSPSTTRRSHDPEPVLDDEDMMSSVRRFAATRYGGFDTSRSPSPRRAGREASRPPVPPRPTSPRRSSQPPPAVPLAVPGKVAVPNDAVSSLPLQRRARPTAVPSKSTVTAGDGGNRTFTSSGAAARGSHPAALPSPSVIVAPPTNTNARSTVSVVGKARGTATSAADVVFGGKRCAVPQASMQELLTQVYVTPPPPPVRPTRRLLPHDAGDTTSSSGTATVSVPAQLGGSCECRCTQCGAGLRRNAAEGGRGGGGGVKAVALAAGIPSPTALRTAATAEDAMVWPHTDRDVNPSRQRDAANHVTFDSTSRAAGVASPLAGRRLTERCEGGIGREGSAPPCFCRCGNPCA